MKISIESSIFEKDLYTHASTTKPFSKVPPIEGTQDIRNLPNIQQSVFESVFALLTMSRIRAALPIAFARLEKIVNDPDIRRFVELANMIFSNLQFHYDAQKNHIVLNTGMTNPVQDAKYGHAVKISPLNWNTAPVIIALNAKSTLAANPKYYLELGPQENSPTIYIAKYRNAPSQLSPHQQNIFDLYVNSSSVQLILNPDVYTRGNKFVPEKELEELKTAFAPFLSSTQESTQPTDQPNQE